MVSISKFVNKITMKYQPLVSVLLPYYNEAHKQINRSINSILGQTYKNIEIIVLNDGRKKNDFKFPLSKKIKYFEFKENLGLANVLNFGISKAKGDFIIRQDADDISLPNRIDILINTIIKNPHIDILGSSCFIIDEKENLLGVRNLSNIHKDLIQNRWRDIPMIHPTWIFSKKLIKKGIKYENYKRGQDQFLLITNYKKLNYYVIFEPLIYYSIRNLSIKLKFMGRRTVFLANLHNKEFFNIIKAFFYMCSGFVLDIFSVISKEKFQLKKITYNISEYEITNFKNYLNELDKNY